MDSQTDHDSVVILIEQGKRVAALLEKHDVAIERLITTRIQYHATAAAYATFIPVLIRLLWKA